ncbi:MAG: GatB/YqeY domain-containing protein [Planctomycetota bacterium]
MAMIADIRAQMLQAMRDKDLPRRDILRVLLGDLETAETRKGSAISDEECLQIVRKLVKSNDETLATNPDQATRDKLTGENKILAELLPKTLSVEDIVGALGDHADAIRAAGNDGQATGIAMRQLKQSGASVQGKDVSEAVRIIRSA